MIRNLMGCLLAIGAGNKPVAWMDEILQGRDRSLAAPTFPADGLYFLGPYYDARHGLPEHTPPMDWLP
jgi:tRNA pseudouridine38-40 synthase